MKFTPFYCCIVVMAAFLACRSEGAKRTDQESGEIFLKTDTPASDPTSWVDRNTMKKPTDSIIKPSDSSLPHHN